MKFESMLENHSEIESEDLGSDLEDFKKEEIESLSKTNHTSKDDGVEEEGEEVSDEMYEHFRVIVDKGQSLMRLDKFLTLRLQNASRNRIQNAAKAGNIIVNGEKTKNNYQVKPNDIVSIVLPHPPRDLELKGENIPLDIVYEDDYLLIVNKPPGMVVHPGYNNFTGTLVNALVWHFDNLPISLSEKRPGLVHRIDKNTSGLLVVAKDEYAMTHLARQFYEHSVKRTYNAVVWGVPDPEQNTIVSNVGRSLQDRKIMTVFKDPTIGKLAITHYKVLENFQYASLVECKLETGRTHQIRVHMKHNGNPLFNDSTYGGEDIHYGPQFSKYKQFIFNCFRACPRQALHAMTLGFIHPYTGKEMFFHQPYPEDFNNLVEKWRSASQYFKWDGSESGTEKLKSNVEEK